MKKDKMGYFFLSIILLLVILAGCDSNKVSSPIYKGPNLSIAVIGTVPNVREKNIKFVNINTNDMSNPDKLSKQFNAIFITKEKFTEVSQSKYAAIFKHLSIPTFFIQTEKSYVPFIQKDLTYNDVQKIENQLYATGILQGDKKLKSWGYGLYNDKKNDTNIKDVYTRIFNTVEKVGQ
jgi:hypothetical protein